MMRKFQKGQSIVEFALILPFFFLLLWGLVYFGLFFSDYLMLNSAARSCAREASLASSEDALKDLATTYQKQIKDKQVTNLYGLKKLTVTAESNDKSKTNKDVVVVINEDIKSADKNSSSLYQVFKNFIGTAAKKDFAITYRMYWEGNPGK